MLGGQDVAVSFASTFFSLLAVWLTYVLGAAVWSRPAGLLAALGLSLDFDVVSLASLGWRDDAYMAAFTLCAYLMLRVWRTGEASPRSYVVLGVGAGLAILTRIMAVPFLVAGVGWILFARRNAWRTHLRGAGLALLAATLTAGPYFVNCWRVYGDPLYTFNVHGAIYSAAEGEAGLERQHRVVRRQEDRPAADCDRRHGRAGADVLSLHEQVAAASTAGCRDLASARRSRRSPGSCARRIAARTSAVDRAW